MITGIVAGGAAAGPPPVDPFWAFVDVLFNFQGADGDTTFTDIKGHAVTNFGAPVIDDSVYPAGALLFDQVSYLRVAGLAPFGTGDFTVETYFNQTRGLSGDPGQFQISTDATGLQPGYANAITSLATGSTWQSLFDGSNITKSFTSGLRHLCMQRVAGVSEFLVDGVSAGIAADIHNYTGTVLAIGGYYSTVYLGGGPCTAFRVTTGAARYTPGGFTPDAWPFPTS